MKRNLLRFLMVFMILTAQSCLEKDDCHRVIKLVNNSIGDIWIAESGSQYNGLNCQQIPGLISAGESYDLEMRVCWEDRINRTYQGAVVFYFFDESFKDNFPDCDSIRFNQSVIERRTYTVEDLNALNWVVTYQ
ncbi:hypothetical protein ACFOUP_00515 [Belliella kenyensis]|uniref:Lipoprotein n=1 Tax=Belliella kenyensis TaxID=1472724 RepID=A0ABV8EGS8_9BACT|nr:hypothetical protein [Belliella kenyensis]MCH7401820.1 hypothetical protein [Belliella kenyensis]MDN3604320.1 hypothetical protein [Belliella kenyensis]